MRTYKATLLLKGTIVAAIIILGFAGLFIIASDSASIQLQRAMVECRHQSNVARDFNLSTILAQGEGKQKNSFSPCNRAFTIAFRLKTTQDSAQILKATHDDEMRFAHGLVVRLTPRGTSCYGSGSTPGGVLFQFADDGEGFALCTTQRVNDGQWHQVLIVVDATVAHAIVDGISEPTVRVPADRQVFILSPQVASAAWSPALEGELKNVSIRIAAEGDSAPL